MLDKFSDVGEVVGIYISERQVKAWLGGLCYDHSEMRRGSSLKSPRGQALLPGPHFGSHPMARSLIAPGEDPCALEKWYFKVKISFAELGEEFLFKGFDLKQGTCWKKQISL